MIKKEIYVDKGFFLNLHNSVNRIENGYGK